MLDLIDASALLWRLHLRGIDVGGRWQTVADAWMPMASAGNYVFNDVHAVMSFVGGGRLKVVDAVIESQQAAMAGVGDNAAFTREVGHPVTLAMQAFGRGDYGETVRRLRAVREIAHRFGGSHAQRDVLRVRFKSLSSARHFPCGWQLAQWKERQGRRPLNLTRGDVEDGNCPVGATADRRVEVSVGPARGR